LVDQYNYQFNLTVKVESEEWIVLFICDHEETPREKQDSWP